MLKTERLDWVDIYKGIAIILMVVGHATGLFNHYIYQFHMAAFFFISGCVVNNKKEVMWKLIINKFFTLLLPLITFVLGGSLLLYVLNYFGLCDKLFSLPYMGGFGTVKIFFTTGDIYIQYLGACWFLIVLFGISVVNKIVYTISTENLTVYALCSIALYLAGYECVERGIVPKIGIFTVDLILIAQIYFVFGCIFKESKDKVDKIFSSLRKNLICLVCNISLLLYFPNIGSVTVDFPSHAFNSPFLDMLIGFNGIFFVYNIAVIISKTNNIVNKVLQYIGRNTIGILLFHFVAFKILMLFFYLVGTLEDIKIRNAVPSVELSNDWWILFVVVSILFSLCVWEVCKRIPIINFMIGCKRDVYKKIICKTEYIVHLIQKK